MINVKNIPIGSLIKINSANQILILKDTTPLKMWQSLFSLANLTGPLLVLDYSEGIDQIHGEFSQSVKVIFCVRILVTANENKFWLVLNGTSNLGIINLPDDLKDSFRETNKIELFDMESEND